MSKYQIHMRLEDAEGGTWDEDGEFTCEKTDEDSVIDAAINCAMDQFNPSWDDKGNDVPGPVEVTVEIDGFDQNIYIKYGGDDISIY